MRYFLITIFYALIFSAQSQILNEVLSVNYHNESMLAILTDISEQTSVRFAYNPDQFTQNNISYTSDQSTVQQVLDRLLPPAHTYVVRGSYVVVLPVRKEPASPKIQKISGSVRDAENNAELSDVTVYEIHELKPVLSSTKGTYELEVNLPQDITFLAISKANYQDTIIQVTRETKTFNVSLKPIREKTTELISGLDSLKIFRFFTTDKVRNHLQNVTLEETRFFQVALTPGLSTNGFLSGQISNHVSLNIVGGVVNSLDGFEIGGAFNMERNHATGFQIGGAVNIVGDYFKGFQIGGATNLVLGQFHGFQIGGATNMVLGQFRGFQLGGATNHSGDFDGVQLAGAVNTAKNFEGWQIAGGTNHARDVTGVQISSLMNTSRNFDGWQFTSGINYNRQRIKGVQVSSFVNYTDTLRGVQFGIINVANHVESGVPIGFVSWVKDELHHVEVSYNDLTAVNVSFRSGRYKLYSLVQTGIAPSKEIWSYGLGLGSQIPLKNRFQMAIELSENVIQPLGQSYLKGYSADTRLHWRLSYMAAKHLVLQGGPVFHFFHYNPDADDDTAFTGQFGRNPLFEKSSTFRITKGWLGYELLVRF